MFFDSKPKAAAPQPDLANLKVTQTRTGDVFSVAGAAPDFSDFDLRLIGGSTGSGQPALDGIDGPLARSARVLRSAQ